LLSKKQNLAYASLKKGQERAKLATPERPLLQVTLLLDENIKVDERVAYTYLEAVGSCGGFSFVLLVVVRCLLGQLASFTYHREMLEKLYAMEGMQKLKAQRKSNFEPTQQNATLRGLKNSPNDLESTPNVPL